MNTENKYQFHGTPAPWRWELNKNSHQIQICGGVPKYDKLVMDFCRYGMRNGSPRFNVELRTDWNVMERADEFSKVIEGREHHADWFQTIEHPDANLIAAAPELLQACIEALKFLPSLNALPISTETEIGNVTKQVISAIHKALNIK